jgi:hypothetical protein
MPTAWLIKLSGDAGDLQELRDNFSFPECSVVVQDHIYYLTSTRFNSFINANDVMKEAENLLRVINGLAKLKIANWWEIDIARGQKDVHKKLSVDS